MMNNRFSGIDPSEIGIEIGKLPESDDTAVYRGIFSLLDLTTLNMTDSIKSVSTLCRKVNEFPFHFPDLPGVAALCVYPRFVEVVRKLLSEPAVRIASVAGSFPASQSFRSLRAEECRMAIEAGADEIDVVMLVGEFLSGELNMVSDDISAMKEAAGEHHLKVILETGVLQKPEYIYEASILAMNAGADFIKTSTGKAALSATPEAAWVMCQAISDFHKKSGKMVGFKPAGGIGKAQEASVYHRIVEAVNGRAWLTSHSFRIGASRLANDLLTTLEGRKVDYF